MKRKKLFASLFSFALIATSNLSMIAITALSPISTSPAHAQSAGQDVNTLRGCFINTPFTGKIAFNPTNIRQKPTRNSPIVGKFTGIGQSVSFSGITTGEDVPEAWDNQPDNMWYRLADGRGWLASAVVSGYPPRGSNCVKSAWQNPLSGGYTVTSEMGWRSNPTGLGRDYHSGIDLGTGNTTPIVKAARGGRVVFAGWNNQGYGNLVIIEHSDNFRTYYAHLSKISVGVNATVSGGTQIGAVGKTGNSTGNHLHFEVRVSPYNWQTNNRNPKDFIRF